MHLNEMGARRKEELSEGVRCASQTPMGSATPSKTCVFLKVMEKQGFSDTAERVLLTLAIVIASHP
jgi:hypothetical protein